MRTFAHVSSTPFAEGRFYSMLVGTLLSRIIAAQHPHHHLSRKSLAVTKVGGKHRV